MASVDRLAPTDPLHRRILTLGSLPTEILHQILLALPAPAFLAVSQTCTALRALTDTPLLWRHFVSSSYKYWDPRHKYTQALQRPVEDVPWKSWYAARRRLDRRVDALVDSMVANVRGRIETMEMILNIDTEILSGNRDLWDVRDALLRHAECDDDRDDVLARRFWARAAIRRLERARAVSMWSALRNSGGGCDDEDDDNVPSLERLLGCYDMFVDGSMDDAECADVSRMLDAIAAGFRRENPDYTDWDTRHLARGVAAYLRSIGFRGTADAFYHDLPHNFIARALRNDEHPALPIICVAIYCAVATRLGLDAAPCGFPMHVYAVVTCPHTTSSSTMSTTATTGPTATTPTQQERIYIDAFRPDIEVPLSHLTAQLSAMGVNTSSPPATSPHLGPASPAEIILRCSRNILHSVQLAHNRPLNNPSTGHRTGTDNWPDTDVCLYAGLWVSVLLYAYSDPGGDQFGARRSLRHFLPVAMETFQNYYPWDVALWESHVLPLLVGMPEYGSMCEILRVVRKADAMRRPPIRRGEKTGEVKFRVGQVFRHRRFRYMAVVIGWDVKCDASEDWIMQMGIRNLERGEEQSFYHVLVDDKSNRYVAQDNIVLVEDEEPTPNLMALAGRFFLRYDSQARRFISNIREEYPDD